MASFPGLIVVGASARAAAWSARRAGLAPWCVDLFADLDLRRVASVRTIAPEKYPTGFLAALASAPAAPLLYTGGLENRPELVRELGRQFLLWGNGPDVLRRVRCPLLLAQTLQRAGLPAPAVRDSPPDEDGRWLVKPRAGSGGAGIRIWRGQASIGTAHYFQEWVPGLPCSALFLGQSDGTVRLLGATRQLIGEPWLHARPFRYCGSVGPLALHASTHQGFRQLGAALVRDFKLRGLFGVDCIMKDSLPWTVEVNPRYTASVEILEHALQIPILALHGAVFDANHEIPAHGLGSTTDCWAKAILFADRMVRFPAHGPWQDTLGRPVAFWEMPEYADIPEAGHTFAAGQPILTLFARGPSPEECLVRLQDKVRQVEDVLE